jgi:hypothetical protein
MKFIFKAILFAVIFSTNACKKQDATNTIEQTAISEQEKLSITNYLNSRKTRTDEMGMSAIDTVLQQINWDRYYIANDKIGNKLTVFELKNSSLHGMCLLLYAGKNSGKYEDAQLAVVKNKENTGQSKAKVITNIYAGNTLHFTGGVEYYKITKEFIYAYGYKNGKSEYTKTYEVKKGTSIAEETCYNVYLITYWNDGSTTYDLLYSYCVADCPNMQAGGSIVIGTGNIENTARCSSSSNGGGGTGGTNNTSECVNLPTASEILNSSYSVSEVNNTIIGTPFIRPNLGVEERDITKNWTFYNGTTPFGSFRLTSVDRARQRRLNNGGWYFTNVNHVTHGVSASIPFTVVSIVGLASTGIVHSYTSAEMKLDYGVKVEVKCYGNLQGTAEVSGKQSWIFF